MQGSTGTGGLDAGVDARIHAALEELAPYADFTAVEQSDHTFTILLNGQVPLLVEDRQYELSVDPAQAEDPAPYYPEAPPLAQVRAGDGTDITSQVARGSWVRCSTCGTVSFLPISAMRGSRLNRMAKQFADRVNQI